LPKYEENSLPSHQKDGMEGYFKDFFLFHSSFIMIYQKIRVLQKSNGVSRHSEKGKNIVNVFSFLCIIIS